MEYPAHDIEKLSTCTSCQFTEDFSNYWTATIYFRARNGSYKRVPQRPQGGMEGTQGGMVVYYMSDALFDTAQKTKVSFDVLSSDQNAETGTRPEILTASVHTHRSPPSSRASAC